MSSATPNHNAPRGQNLEAIDLSQLDTEVPKGARFEEIPRSVLGYRIFKWLFLLVTGLFVAVITYAVLTYPQEETILRLAGKETDLVSVYKQARADWLDSVKDLGQTFLLAPLLPLLTAVLGYIFGRDEQISREGDT